MCERTALGILRVVNANIERAIRAISLERGYDPRRFTLVAFGGAGPMHSCELAQELGIPRVLVPTRPGILSALGVAIADVVKDYSRTVMLRGDDLARQHLDEEFHGMESQAREELRQERLPVEDMKARRFLDVRYQGQSFELTIDYPAPTRRSNSVGVRRSIADSFYKAHLQRFGYADRAEPVEDRQPAAEAGAGDGKAPACSGATRPRRFRPSPGLTRRKSSFGAGHLPAPLYQREKPARRPLHPGSGPGATNGHHHRGSHRSGAGLLIPTATCCWSRGKRQDSFGF